VGGRKGQIILRLRIYAQVTHRMLFSPSIPPSLPLLLQQLVFLDYDRASAELHPSRFVANLRSFYSYAEPLPWVDVSQTCQSVTNTRVYYERIDLHPLSVALSFAQTVADQKRVGFGGNVMEVVKNLASISRAPVQMKSFQVEHAMETPASFTHIVLAHYKRQAFAQILTIAGSLSTLGSPVDLVTSVGTGVKDFFYEPINGLVHSPKVRFCVCRFPPSLPPFLPTFYSRLFS